jgi:hypothetical protein
LILPESFSRRSEGREIQQVQGERRVESLYTRRGWAPRNNRRYKLGSTLFLASLVLLSIASVTLILAAPGSPAGEVTVSAGQVYTGESLEISIKGFPADYPVPAGSVTLGGVRVAIPGVFGEPGVPPVTDGLGDVTFTVRIPLGVPFGTQTLSVTHFAGDGERTATVSVLAATVSFDPNISSPNQAVVIHGSGFNPVSSPGGKGPLGIHQITGEGSSGIMVNAVLLEAPYVTYPVNLDSDGGLTANLILPEKYVTFPDGTLELKVVDDAGRTGIGVWIVKPRKIVLSPAESGRGGEVTVTGTGFMATGDSAIACTTVDLAYAGTFLKKVSPDSTGSFVTAFTVPLSVGLLSSNAVTATIYGCTAASAATATHKVPSRKVTIAPTYGQTGTHTTLTGVSFVGFTMISAITIGTISVLPSPMPVVDKGGNFSVTVTVPLLAAGVQAVALTIGGVQYTEQFAVVPIPPTPTPTVIPTSTVAPTATVTPTPTATPFPSPTPTITPTPTTAPTPTPAPRLIDSIQPLQSNLLRIWGYNDALGRWDHYDPRPSFASSNNLTTLAGGRLYWINMSEDLIVTLNGRERFLIAGWNLIHW